MQQTSGKVDYHLSQMKEKSHDQNLFWIQRISDVKGDFGDSGRIVISKLYLY